MTRIPAGAQEVISTNAALHERIKNLSKHPGKFKNKNQPDIVVALWLQPHKRSKTVIEINHLQKSVFFAQNDIHHKENKSSFTKRKIEHLKVTLRKIYSTFLGVASHGAKLILQILSR
ncbi:MAG: hypothetical protein COY58_01670 [Gammaproteobacteria bacterium CG_4_10_14_0_8_um_filter_38_16]|nr:MAG: hypothetical protein COY58_01670 [Gammaproteobacteria bacterium CG_4_10_14_0_8_um_filter_38_16]PJA04436.1 MAG: hypothetical protein COX72_00060 [Gammaproteobacteria bacterium CG_4_10_14_0_2_um_filter_38_22]PJB09464.1 MAG: hypothetical protein CO120_09925 [Gammaproteobacteria bacterium CG_4_9_14_3_um_filter_38_9]